MTKLAHNKKPPRTGGPPPPRGLFPSALFVVALFLAGCVPSPADLDRVHAAAEQMRQDVNAASESLASLAPLVRLVCGGEVRPAQCDAVDAAWSVAQQATDAANAAIEIYDATGRAAGAVESAVGEVRRAADVVRTAVDRLGSAL